MLQSFFLLSLSLSSPAARDALRPALSERDMKSLSRGGRKKHKQLTTKQQRPSKHFEISSGRRC